MMMLESETEPLPPSPLLYKIKPGFLLVSSGGEIDDPDYVPYEISNIEMMGMERYESLKDVLASSPTKTWERRDSWREIPIKDPLVQHAAWAYLMAVPAPEGDDRRDGCCEFIRYFLNVLVGRVRNRSLFGGDKGSDDCRVD